MRLASAPILRGSVGVGRSSHLHTAKILRLSEDLLIVIEIVDSEEKIGGFPPGLDEMMGGGLVKSATIGAEQQRCRVMRASMSSWQLWALLSAAFAAFT